MYMRNGTYKMPKNTPTKTEERAPTTTPKDDDPNSKPTTKNHPVLIVTKTKSKMDQVRVILN